MSWFPFHSATPVQSYNLTGLEDFTNYTVQVAVRNSNGSGMMSDPMTGVTCDGRE